jgi:hypothetical protein
MGVPTSEVGYTSATTGRGDHEVHKGHVVELAQKTLLYLQCIVLRLNIIPYKNSYLLCISSTEAA